MLYGITVEKTVKCAAFKPAIFLAIYMEKVVY